MNNNLPQRLTRRSRRGVILTAVAMLLMALAGLRPPAPVLASCGAPTLVDTADEFMDAIDDFNGQAGSCDFTIELTADILLNDYDWVDIDNDNGNATLTINGGGHLVDLDYWNDGFYISAAGEVTIHDITLSETDSSAIHVIEGSVRFERSTIQRSDGYGIYITGGELVVEESTIAGNGWAGVYITNENATTTSAWIINSTIAGYYKGVEAYSANVQLTHVTIANSIETSLHVGAKANVIVNNSILSGSNENCYLESTGGVSINNSLVKSHPSGSCGVMDGANGNLVGHDPNLAQLGDYGGPTHTMPPLELSGDVTTSSPVIDQGDNSLSENEDGDTLATDQRGAGFPRLVGATVDMGAVEGAKEFECDAALTQVSNAAELALAIDCFNQISTDVDYTIEFQDDITLTMPLPVIANSTSGIHLIIDGANHTLDGDFEFDTIDIDNTQDVSFDRLTITGSDSYGIHANSSNIYISRSTIGDNRYSGIYAYHGELFVVESTVVGNSENGIEFRSDGQLFEAYIINSTLFDNGLAGGYPAVWANGGYMTFVNSTIYKNNAGIDVYRADLTVNNSIVAGNDNWDCRADESAQAFNNSLMQVIEDEYPCEITHGTDGNLVGVEPLLGRLGDYGGPTQTIPPLQFTGGVVNVSPAVNAGDNDLAEDEDGDSLTTDQRGAGFPRIAGGTVDMGAHEGALVINCAAFPRTVGNQTQLNDAIDCYYGVMNPGVYTINLSADINLTASTATITNKAAGVSLLINGNGNTIDGQDSANTRPLTIARDTTVTLNDAVITGGNSDDSGGGIRNSGDLTINNSRVESNRTEDDGGGIYNSGDLTINNSRVELNRTEDDGGGIYNRIRATLTMNNSAVDRNLAAYPDGDGGGIDNAGLATLTDVSVSGNVAEADFNGYGGGILNEGAMTITRGVIDDNTLIADEYWAVGGGIANEANLVIRDSVISNNSITGLRDALGGGIHSDASDDDARPDEFGAQLLIINSTISGNSVTAEENARGGGLYAEDCCVDDPNPVTLINVTLVNNAVDADFDSSGGGAYFYQYANGLNVTIHNSILAGNSTDGSLGGDCVRNDNVIDGVIFESRHSLYQDTGEGACELAAANPDADGNIVGQAPNLGPLADNGGPTRTHMPNAGSPAIDSGDNDLADDEEGDPLTADQRGYTPRVVNATVDMGAVEVGAEGPPVDTAIFMSTKTSGTTTDGVVFDNSDILKWDGSAWSKFFDGTDAHLDPVNKPKHNVNAFWIDPATDDIIMSFAQNSRKVNGLVGNIDGMDLVKWDGSDFSLWFDGSDVGLTKKTQEKIDALHVLPGDAAPAEFGDACISYLLVSTQGPGAVPAYGGGQIKFGGEDILGFCMTNWGGATAGFWHMVLDGSAVGLPKNALDSISASPDGNVLYFTTSKVVVLPNASGGHSMIYAYDTTTNTFSGPLFKAADYGLKAKVDGLQVVGEVD